MNDILQDLSPSAVPQAMDANAISFWTFFSHLPQVELHNDPGTRWFETGIHHDVFNRVFQTRLETDAFPVEIDRVSSYFHQRCSLVEAWLLSNQ